MIRDLEGKKEKTNRKRKSVFLLTINTNKSFNSKNVNMDKMQIIKKKLITLLEDLLTEKNIIRLTLDMGPIGTPRTEAKPIESNKIYEIKYKSQIEANTDGNGFLHSHSVIEIIHKTRVLINLPRLKNVIYKFMEPVLTIDNKFYKPYVKVKGATSQAFAMENYVSEGKEIIQVK